MKMSGLQWHRLSRLLNEACKHMPKGGGYYRTLRAAQAIVQERRAWMFLQYHREKLAAAEKRKKRVA